MVDIMVAVPSKDDECEHRAWTQDGNLTRMYWDATNRHRRRFEHGGKC